MSMSQLFQSATVMFEILSYYLKYQLFKFVQADVHKLNTVNVHM